MARLEATFAGKVLVITGAGGGLGRAAALACAARGADLVLCDLGCDLAGNGADPSVLGTVREQVAAHGGGVETLAIDATAPEAPDALVELARKRFGRVDGVFAAAGIVREHALARLSDMDLKRVLEVHAVAAIRLARAAGVAMQAQNEGGAIVVSSGQAAYLGQRGQTAYCAAAAAVTGFVRAAALELRRHRVRVNAISPLARTRATEALPMFQSLRPDSLSAESVAACVAYLLSDLASDVSGECVGVAGNRIYTLRLHESTGAFLEGEVTPEAIAGAWAEASKP